MHCWSSRFVHWRRPRGTLSSRQTTLLTAACTQTAKGARCPPSTAGLTPALNQSPRSRPTERSCAWSPARPRSTPVLQTDSFCPPAPDSSYLSALGPAFLRQSRRQGGDCVREVLSCIKRFYLPFSSWQASCHSFCGPATTFKTPKVRQLCSFEGLYAFQTS